MLHGIRLGRFSIANVVRELRRCRAASRQTTLAWGFRENRKTTTIVSRREIADIEALVASLGPKRVHLIVHDWVVRLDLVLRHGIRTDRRIVILNTAAFSTHIPRRIALCRAGAFGEWLVRGLKRICRPRLWMSTVRPLAGT